MLYFRPGSAAATALHPQLQQPVLCAVISAVSDAVNGIKCLISASRYGAAATTVVDRVLHIGCLWEPVRVHQMVSQH